MALHSTKPVDELKKEDLIALLEGKQFVVGPHALDHLSDQQRDSFEEKELLQPLERETPRKIYLQENDRYCVYYRTKSGYRKLIQSVEKSKVVIVSYMDNPTLPRINI